MLKTQKQKKTETATTLYTWAPHKQTFALSYVHRDEGNAFWRLACCVCVLVSSPLFALGNDVRTGEHRKTKFWRENFDISFGRAIRKQVAKA